MRIALLMAPLLLLAACSEPPKATKKEPPKPLEPLTGRQAFQQMYISARSWAPDCQPLELKSIGLNNGKAPNGKSGAWQCTFVSPARARAKTYTWSAIEAEGNLHKGVFAGQDESYSPSRQVQPFLTAAIKTDSDEAYEAAAKKAADFLKKSPDKPVNYLLELTPRFPDLAWRIYWGESLSTSEYSVFIDATTGQYLDRIR